MHDKFLRTAEWRYSCERDAMSKPERAMLGFPQWSGHLGRSVAPIDYPCLNF